MSKEPLANVFAFGVLAALVLIMWPVLAIIFGTALVAVVIIGIITRIKEK